MIDLSSEFEFQTSRSSGPGGQHVNKTETRVTLRFSIPESTMLSDEQKALLLEKLSTHLTTEGVLLISCQETRSQTRNKEISVERFNELIKKAFKKKRKRIPTKPTKASKRKRLEGKKEQGVKKQLRRKPDTDM
ncbi:MAG: alternative ribosome rescue aminoacyl-tRNA hydrolase ArfB [Salinivirgaceae bacterium]|jgi:ribosome-associated protein|nr:alternative ribosome rescue aminoacyl-tRNA hydrolase ArfB [Salinivirgaceae bacterium]